MKFVYNIVLFCLSFAALAEQKPTPAEREYNWVQTYQAKKFGEVSTFVSRVPSQAVKAFKGIIQLPYPRHQVVEAMADAKNYPSWIYRCIGSDTSIPNDDDGRTLYLKFRGFWFVKNRDATINVNMWHDKASDVVHITALDFDSDYPAQPGLVRMNEMDNRWKLIETAPGRTEVHFETFVDISGSVPKWIANIIANYAPRRTLNDLKKLLNTGRYVANSFDDVEFLDERLRIRL